MPRTPGATNKTPRELRQEAKLLNLKADYLEAQAKLKRQAPKAKGATNKVTRSRPATNR